MVVASLSCTISVQETTASSLKQPVPRTSLAPQKGHRRSLDVSAHVLATQVSSPDAHAVSSAAQPSAGICMDATSHTHWTPGWTKALQTKFSAVWERWQKLSAQISQYKTLRPDWVGHTQGLLDQQFQRFLSNVGAAATARPVSTATTRPRSAVVNIVGARSVTLTPYLTVADEVEVSFAAMLADLCNMAYEVDKLEPELIEARHRLSLIATSITCGGTCQTAAETAVAFQTGSGAEGGQYLQASSAARLAAVLAHDHAQSAAPGVVSFTIGSSPSLSPSISMLQLTSPEAVTAALTSQGHGAAFAHPVYVSTLHHALTSMGSYDEEGDISDLELRAAMVAGGPRALFLGGGVGSLGTIGTMGTLDDIPNSMMLPLQKQQLGGDGVGAAALAAITAGMQDMHATAVGPASGAASVSVTSASMDAAAGRAAVASGTLFSDISLSEDRDFVAGHFYGYKTPLVERRRSSDGGPADDSAPLAAVTQSGAAGGRALREEQSMRRRSSSGGALSGEDFGMDDGLLEGGEMSAVPGGPPVVVACTKAPPSAWFACDDKLTKTRYFAIQGSTSLEHWQINLQFEPVIFEDPKYGVRIHRGVYEAAKVLYSDLLPLVQQHLETSPHATVSFAGHSLGGSLGTVLMLLFVIRGVMKPSNISPVYTFGAPAVFCQGAVADAPADRCTKCTLNCEMRTAAAATGEQHSCSHDAHHAGGALAGIAATAASMEQVQTVPLGLMPTLGLSDDQVVNVIMHKDIVPRAFVCDYTAVAGVLQRWWPSFRDHHTLQDDVGPHKSLYNFVGRVAVLRPCPDLPFVNGPADASHPMLPNHPALYRVGLHDDGLPPMDHAAASLASWDELMEGLSAMASGACRRSSAAAAARRAAKLENMQQSVLQFMNQPHPLTTLSDYQAYGPQGFISRYHNPDNYTRALVALTGR